MATAEELRAQAGELLRQADTMTPHDKAGWSHRPATWRGLNDFTCYGKVGLSFDVQGVGVIRLMLPIDDAHRLGRYMMDYPACLHSDKLAGMPSPEVSPTSNELV